MNDIQIHALGLQAAVNGFALSRRAAHSHALRAALREEKRDRRARRRRNRTTQAGPDAFTTLV